MYPHPVPKLPGTYERRLTAPDEPISHPLIVIASYGTEVAPEHISICALVAVENALKENPTTGVRAKNGTL